MRNRLIPSLAVVIVMFFGSRQASADGNDPSSARRDAIIVRALERMPGYDYSQNGEVQEAIERHIRRQRGTAAYLELVKRFRPRGWRDKLERVMLQSDNASLAVGAAQTLLAAPSGPDRVRRILDSDDSAKHQPAVRILGLLGNREAVSLLTKVAKDAERPYELRAAAVRGLGRNNLGAKTLLDLAEVKSLPGDTRLLAGGLLSGFDDKSIRNRAAQLLPLPKRADQEPLPPLGKLAQMKGQVRQGRELFRGKATCSNCHVVNDHGKEVGPNLSEIGSKLSREAMLTSILDPSAGISHNYENHVVLLDTGQVVTGLKMTETGDRIVIRNAEGVDREIPKEQIESMRQSEKSLMPEELHHVTGPDGLINIVEYLMTLKKKAG